MDKLLKQVFDYAEKLAKDFYFNIWAKNSPECPAFDGEVVYITRSGWEHIADDPEKSRMDKLGRFCTFERAKALLETASHFQDYIKSSDGRFEFWGINGVVDLVKVRVIVRSVNEGHKHFYSVIRKGSVESEE